MAGEEEKCAELDELGSPAIKPALKPSIQALAKYTAARNFREELIDFIITHPAAPLWEISKVFKYSIAWLSTIISSDAFQVAMAIRREQLVDPELKVQLEDHFRGLALRSAEVLGEKMSRPTPEISDSLATRVFDLSTRAAGFGTKVEASAIASGVQEALEKHGDQLLSLLRRKRAEASTIDAEVVTSEAKVN